MSTQYRDLADYIATRARQLEHNTLSLSEALGYGRSYINAIVNDQFTPSKKRCREIAQFFDDDPGIILTLAGYQEPLKDDDPIITQIIQTASTFPRSRLRQLLDYTTYLKDSAPLPAALREKQARYSGTTIYIELPNGDELTIPTSFKVAALPTEDIEHIITTALNEAASE